MEKFSVKILIIIIFILVIFTENSDCKVEGNCSNCHTMHRSQGFWPWNPNWGGPASDPLENLLVADCVGCHTNYTDGSPIITLNLQGSYINVPVVYNTASPPTSLLAGGNFYWVGHGDDNKGHNVLGIAGQDINMATAPGNTYGCVNSCHFSLAVKQTIMPAMGSGCKGCHLIPQHHADDQGPVVDNDPSGEGWFRFLSGHFAGQGHGVSGIEDADWQATKSAGDHNEYLGYDGKQDTAGGISALGHTMTGFCTGCHGRFHIERLASSWTRHPSDFTIPNTGEYANAFGAAGTGTGVYNPDIPVARPDLSGWTVPGSTVTLGPGGDLVMCLSCHRAHGSPYSSMLRWDYRGNDWSGCGACHTEKQ